MTIDVNVSKAMNESTMTVTVRPTRVWLLKLRVLVGCWLIHLGAKVMGVGTIHFDHDQGDERCSPP